MRPSINFVSSTGESLRIRKSFPISSMEAKATSLSVINVQPSKDFLVVPQIPESPYIRDDERHAKLILCADLRDVDPPVFQREPAAASVIACLHDLALQRFVCKVVPDTSRKIEPLPVFAAVARKRMDLVRKRLLKGRLSWRD